MLVVGEGVVTFVVHGELTWAVGWHCSAFSVLGFGYDGYFRCWVEVGEISWCDVSSHENDFVWSMIGLLERARSIDGAEFFGTVGVVAVFYAPDEPGVRTGGWIGFCNGL